MDLAPSLRFSRPRHRYSVGCGTYAERFVAVARVWTATGVLVLVWLDSGQPDFRRNLAAAYVCAFLVYSVVVLSVVRRHRAWTARVGLLLYGGDMFWAILLPSLISDPRTFLLVFLFVLTAAAERWGPRGMLEMGGAVALVVGGELLLLPSGGASSVVRDALSSSSAAQLSWSAVSLSAAGLLWFLVRFEATQRWETSANAAQRAHARVSIELHDTVVQSLYTIECRLERLRSRTADLSPSAADDLTGLQQLLHKTEVKLRDIMRQGRPLELGSKTFIGYIRSSIAEFEQETGIAVRFVCDCAEISPPQAVAGELVRIVQEALQNVRKHSGARNVSLGCGFAEGCWRFWIDDDGQGFDFSGRLGMLELETLAQGPFVIRERVSALGGELAIESTPGHGARLEIAVPRDALG